MINSHGYDSIKLCLFSPQHHNIESPGPGSDMQPQSFQIGIVAMPKWQICLYYLLLIIIFQLIFYYIVFQNLLTIIIFCISTQGNFQSMGGWIQHFMRVLYVSKCLRHKCELCDHLYLVWKILITTILKTWLVKYYHWGWIQNYIGVLHVS